MFNTETVLLLADRAQNKVIVLNLRVKGSLFPGNCRPLANTFFFWERLYSCFAWQMFVGVCLCVVYAYTIYGSGTSAFPFLHHYKLCDNCLTHLAYGDVIRWANKISFCREVNQSTRSQNNEGLFHLCQRITIPHMWRKSTEQRKTFQLGVSKHWLASVFKFGG